MFGADMLKEKSMDMFSVFKACVQKVWNNNTKMWCSVEFFESAFWSNQSSIAMRNLPGTLAALVGKQFLGGIFLHTISWWPTYQRMIESYDFPLCLTIFRILWNRTMQTDNHDNHGTFKTHSKPIQSKSMALFAHSKLTGVWDAHGFDVDALPLLHWWLRGIRWHAPAGAISAGITWEFPTSHGGTIWYFTMGYPLVNVYITMENHNF